MKNNYDSPQCECCEEVVEMELVGGYTSQIYPYYEIEIFKCPICGKEVAV